MFWQLPEAGKRCFFCGELGHSRLEGGRRKNDDPSKPLCPYWLSAKHYCKFPLCGTLDRYSHMTRMCPVLQGRCGRCGGRGHLDHHDDELSIYDLHALFELYAPLGLFTRRRFTNMAWGYYYLNSPRAVRVFKELTGVSCYEETLDIDVHEAADYANLANAKADEQLSAEGITTPAGLRPRCSEIRGIEKKDRLKRLEAATRKRKRYDDEAKKQLTEIREFGKAFVPILPEDGENFPPFHGQRPENKLSPEAVRIDLGREFAPTREILQRIHREMEAVFSEANFEADNDPVPGLLLEDTDAIEDDASQSGR